MLRGNGKKRGIVSDCTPCQRRIGGCRYAVLVGVVHNHPVLEQRMDFHLVGGDGTVTQGFDGRIKM